MSAEFDKYAKGYREILDAPLALTGESSSFFAEYKTQKLAEWLPEFYQGTPQTILDFGCGDGLMTHFVSQQFPQSIIHGVDPSTESIKIAQESYPNITFGVSGDTLENFADNTFDVIFSAGVFHHIPFELHEHYTKELLRILNKNGILVIFELNPFNPATRYIFKHSPVDIHATMLYPNYAQKLLTPYGIPKIKFYGFFPNLLKNLRWSEKFLTKVPLGGLYAAILKK